ncbi:hypothetical protein IJQ51_02750 [Candidatus Saccharibacteria bacterium]|nr:hypothetical protein [Candidatus Saccharibacteria bacterium]
MSAEEVLKLNEQSALKGEIISHVVGKSAEKRGRKIKGFSATAFVTAIILVFVVLFSSGNLIPVAISERLIEETDVQYADAVESKILVFQQALVSGEVPNNTVARLKDNGVLVGRVTEGEFQEGASGTNLALKMGEKIVTAENFAREVNADVQLYNAFNNATYSRAAYYYDDAASEVFKKIGTNRNNYTAEDDFIEVVNGLMGEGNDIDVNNVELVEKQNEQGEKYYEYETVGGEAAATTASNFVTTVGNKNTASSSNLATLNAADTLNVADTIAKEQKSSLLFVAFMENISKMKAGDGNESKINETMNYLYQETESTVVDVETGEIKTVKGSMMEAPSLYAVLSGEKVDTQATSNYSSDRVLKTVENQLGATAGDETLLGTVTSVAGKIKGSIGRFLNSGTEGASVATLNTITPTIENSLVKNNFESIGGIAGGEMLVEGAVNVGRALAQASGATAGDSNAIQEYARLNNAVLAMDAAADRLNRSPLDITSKNTFLGAIVYKLAVGAKATNLTKMMANVVSGIFPAVYAEDETDSYLANFGDCETLGAIGAVGSATCATVATFDTSTLNNTFNDAGFIQFVEANTELKDGVRVIKDDSDLADFIKYNDERITPVGVMDGGILSAVQTGSKISFLDNILSMIKTFLGATEREKQIATGAAFVNSSSNANWDVYKYAQRYVSLARATEALRKYDGEETAYNNLKYFEGTMSPVVAFLNNYYNMASK